MALPGTSSHQHLWDRYSDLDLDVITADGVTIDVLDEAQRLCHALGQTPVVIDPDGEEAVDIELPSLLEMSLRYHPLNTTSPTSPGPVSIT